ncbi:NADP-dependent oxidoreductase [Streptomyces phyllanthi]|uniref:NADP-dependent oxidoreductase n=2 Tax=Streptomyces phyllanthi TaxID=1803180 RepID=A0A5N8W0Z0_9ACTN|nr:NADP-dependent oxidoreductase [Streptomyces phyllanthi]
MRAALIDDFGPAEVLRVGRVPVPVPGPGEVLVRVRAAGINAIDWATRAGHGVGLPAFPAVLGWDIAGTVAATGPGADRFTEGEAVFGMPLFPAPAGAYAEYAVAPEAHLARTPPATGHVAAAALPMVALTAWETLFGHGGLRAGQRVLVAGASGGVGHVAVQLAADAGAEVIGTASARNREFVLSLGAKEVVAHDMVREVMDVDLAVDPMGGAEFFRLLDVVRPGGVVVTLKGEGPEHRRAAEEHKVRSAFTYVRPDGAVLEEKIAPLLSAGRLRPFVDRTFPLDEVAQAHALGEQGHVRGRLVLDLS